MNSDARGSIRYTVFEFAELILYPKTDLSNIAKRGGVCTMLGSGGGGGGGGGGR
jgi:hypothetical protein